MSPLTIARIEVELVALAAALKARVPDLTPAKLRALMKRLRRAMGRADPMIAQETGWRTGRRHDG